MTEALAVKMIYTWPGDFFFRFWFSDKVIAFVQENNWTQLVAREDAYALIRDERSGSYLRMEWDPKAVAKSVYASPGIRQMNGSTAIWSEGTVIQITDGNKTIEADLPEAGEVTPEESSELDNLLGKLSNNKGGETSSDGIGSPGAAENTSPPLKENIPSSSANFSNTIVADVVDEANVASDLS